jgi:hypothetical protein
VWGLLRRGWKYVAVVIGLAFEKREA